MNKVTHLSVLMFVLIAIFLVSCTGPSQETLEMVSNLSAQRYDNGVKLTWDYDLSATFDVYRGSKDNPEHLGTTTEKYFIDEDPDPAKNYYYVKATYNGKTSGLKEIVVDLQAPQVSISSPTDGKTLQGTVTIEASTTDDTKVAKVEFYIDGTKAGEDNDSPYQYSWDTSGLTNNSTHTIQAKAYDTTGNMGESDVITVIVRNNRLEVTIVNPTDGDTVQETVIIEASVEADNEVAKVEFYIDGTRVGEDNDSPYQYNWDTSGLENNSTHTIQARAYDTTGNMGESSVITVIVKNPIPQITILSPTNGETLQGTVTIVAEAYDDEGVSQVDFFINDTLWESVTSEPYEYDWNTHKVIDGIYTIKAEVTDSSENSNSASIDVTVNNGQKTFGGAKYDGAYAIQQTGDGGYIAAGYTTSFEAGNDDIYVLKLDSTGSFKWQNAFGGSSDDLAYSIQQTEDGGYIVAGWTYSSGAGGYDAYVLKLLPNGDLDWEKTFGGTGEDKAHFIQQTTDGGYIVAGWTYSSGAGNGDVYVLKLDSAGTLQWQKTFGGSNEDGAYSIQQTKDGGYIVAGWIYSSGADNRDAYVIKLNSDGNLEWQKTFGGSNEDAAYSIQQTSDGGYIVAGWTKSSGAGGYDAYVLKLLPNGDLDWEKTFGGSNVDEAYSIQQTSDGGYIVAGETNSFGTGGYDTYVLKLRPNGDLEWERTFGGYNNDYAYSIQQTTDGGYVVAGWTYSFASSDDHDVYILKLDSNGDLHPFQ